MPAPFPHRYQTTLVRTLGSRARVEAAPRAPIAGGPPPEFDGDATSWSPEHLLLSAIGLCLLTTFEAFAVRDKVDLLAWEAQVRATVAKTSSGLAFTKLSVEVDMEVGNVEQAYATLEIAKRHCLVSNALSVPIEIVPTIRPAQLRAS
jgi:organic hydroperoxide reductase OsmC/OhrA